MQLYLFACISLVGTFPPWILWFQQGTSGTSVHVPGALVLGVAAFLGKQSLEHVPCKASLSPVVELGHLTYKGSSVSV